MKRDLIREILLVAEAAEPEQCVALKDFEKSHADRLEEVSEHVQLLDRIECACNKANHRVVYIRFIGTHIQYDEIDAQTI